MSSQSRPTTAAGRKVERSCAVCHRRKVRCDKQLPCNQCIRGGYSCGYPQPTQSARRTRKTTMNDVADRISELEKTLSVVSRDHRARTSTARISPPRTTSPLTEHSTASRTTEYEGEEKNDEVLLKKGSSSQYFNEVLLSRVLEHVTPLSLHPISGPNHLTGT